MAKKERGRKVNPWYARATINDKTINLGRFSTQEEADRKECQFLEEEFWGPPPMPNKKVKD